MNERFVSIAKRENNAKRGFLIVNPLQGKHVPVSPATALSVFDELAEKIKEKYKNENLLFIGFAETATAIGAEVAISSGFPYIQTTRENIQDAEYIFFSEEHSHATEQKLVKNDFDKVIFSTDRIIFVEDEVSTGKTIRNIIRKLTQLYEKKISFSVMSVLNGMTEDDNAQYSDLNLNVDFIFLEKIDRTNFEKIASGFDSVLKRGEENQIDVSPVDFSKIGCKFFSVGGYMNARRLVDSSEYKNACERFAKEILEKIGSPSGKKILVLGTEEFMYPTILTGKKIEQNGNFVRTHSTTRSPISVFDSDSASGCKKYPLYSRFTLASLYDEERTTYIYNLDYYDKILIITDSSAGYSTDSSTDSSIKEKNKKGLLSLINAVRKFSGDISVIRWEK